ncbi:MAG: glycine cleavage system protein GcvH [Elusimicrobiales bacterium]|jgi:glycine cleavage system H protein|nr:glycine cleavage system protein GcvH [Elusimicrobiales bacterium]HOJ87118.1 glycine cleavage system protein GcvH [Elusimicrobiales bacterium]HOL62175.1 glycine cleavage system protein GcvH [Elusimicrobiales bacterium]HPO94680.1 glycine cleavage system protein GcvH [Elusimicrobiales bacterium]
MNKENLKYTKTHEWIGIEGDVAYIGVSDFAQSQMGDIVFVDLPKVGAKAEKEKQICVVESVKSAFDIYSPVNGEVIEVNSALSDNPALINQEPYGNGWICKMKISDKSQLDSLMDFKTYEEFVKTQAH